MAVYIGSSSRSFNNAGFVAKEGFWRVSTSLVIREIPKIVEYNFFGTQSGAVILDWVNKMPRRRKNDLNQYESIYCLFSFVLHLLAPLNFTLFLPLLIYKALQAGMQFNVSGVQRHLRGSCQWVMKMLIGVFSDDGMRSDPPIVSKRQRVVKKYFHWGDETKRDYLDECQGQSQAFFGQCGCKDGIFRMGITGWRCRRTRAQLRTRWSRVYEVSLAWVDVVIVLLQQCALTNTY